jgi:TDG/mug DNA glycosylase family protein
VLVLGSLPGRESLARQQYYAHPRNQFWRLIGAVVDADLVDLPYDDRLAALAGAGVGLWDVVGQASRVGSLDSAIRDPQPNDLAALLRDLPGLAAIGFNGGAAFKIGGSLLADSGVPLIRLPSSSPAHAAMSFATKRDAWLALRPWLDAS